MKLLFDENISFRVLKEIQSFFPGSIHVNKIILKDTNDISIWDYARRNDFTIVTFDEDFNELSNLKGYPPKIIWLRCGNTSTQNIAEKLKSHYSLINTFLYENADEQGCLEIY
ncbi:MAG: DUF5615 family PIN-like protein [Ignavibacteria bacterium]|nr:DUF5615 family PIN-like protein [Ignavibacteria bacterium]